MAQQLRDPLFLQRLWVPFPTPTWWLITICNSGSRGDPKTFSGFCRCQAHKGCTETYKGKTPISINQPQTMIWKTAGKPFFENVKAENETVCG